MTTFGVEEFTGAASKLCTDAFGPSGNPFRVPPAKRTLSPCDFSYYFNSTSTCPTQPHLLEAAGSWNPNVFCKTLSTFPTDGVTSNTPLPIAHGKGSHAAQELLPADGARDHCALRHGVHAAQAGEQAVGAALRPRGDLVEQLR